MRDEKSRVCGRAPGCIGVARGGAGFPRRHDFFREDPCQAPGGRGKP
jgi:hypothetical protein